MRQAKLFVIAYTNSQSSGELLYLRSLARTVVIRSYKHC